MLIELKGYTKSAKHQLEEDMEYDARQVKPKWKASMMFMNAIHVFAKNKIKNGKVGGNIFADIDDYL
jgi:hypothetical protein